jgi:hypothetical protein
MIAVVKRNVHQSRNILFLDFKTITNPKITNNAHNEQTLNQSIIHKVIANTGNENDNRSTCHNTGNVIVCLFSLAFVVSLFKRYFFISFAVWSLKPTKYFSPKKIAGTSHC